MSLVAAAVLFAPVAAIGWEMESEALPYVLGSAALELAYFGLLAAAYARAHVTFVYPVARGSAPVLVLVVSVTLLGAGLGTGQVAGVLAVVAGILLVRGVAPAGDGRALALALGVGACIAGYTLVDDHGVRHASALAYFEAVLVLTAVPFAALVAARDGMPALRDAVTGRAVLAGAGMFGAYALALAALERAEAAPVAALRETGVVMAALGALVLGRERITGRRLAGAAAVVAGAAAIALG